MLDLVYPRQVVLITTRHDVEDPFSSRKEEKDDIFACDWHMPLSREPKMYAIAVHKDRFSLSLIQNSKFFCINFVSHRLEKQVIEIEKHNSQHIDKFSKAEIELEECNTITCGRLINAVGYFECEVVDEIDTGDHVLFIAKVMHITEKDNLPRLFQKNNDGEFVNFS
tara:strand:+ start:249 stop:749 length:501 start_codon:yes stop_codon:yes gene_type:complete